MAAAIQVYAWKGLNEDFDWCIEQTLFFGKTESH
jgi:adenosylhomocysteinase